MSNYHVLEINKTKASSNLRSLMFEDYPGGAKDEHFSCFHSSCQIELSVQNEEF